jgi:hypothetical protein
MKDVLMNGSADLLVALGRVLISVWVIYGIFRYGRTLEPVVRRVRWAIVSIGFLAFWIVLKFFPNASLYGTAFLIVLPTVLFLILPDLAVQLVRAFRAIRQHFASKESQI